MVVTKIYCDKCKKELKSFPPYESSKVTIDSETWVKPFEGLYGAKFIHEVHLFGEDDDIPAEFILCHDCGVKFKKYLKNFWKN